ncbi:MFS transporter [Sphingomonas elodea]|uniref:MFS transporter n=1 Tax=Sphingomonas elodea TaxID=179878 RepID=UPI0002630A90|nr:MFS transporter [Sphingomonas elodea]
MVARLFRRSIGIFFLGGFVTALVGLLVPRLTLVDGLDYTRATFVQFAFHSSYLLFALPITMLLVRTGYMRAIAIGLAVMTLACVALGGAAWIGSYALLLAALLALSTGITFLQIAANVVQPLVATEGGGAARLTLLQGFNSIGTVLAPLLGAGLLLHAGGGFGRLPLALPFLACALALAGLCLAFWQARDLLADHPAPRRLPLAELIRVLRTPRLAWGSLAMFGYVGAEVTIGSLLTNYLAQPAILGADPATAGRLVSLYWGGAMLGRFAGAFGLARIAPARLLAMVAIAAVALIAIATQTQGPLGAAALLGVGLCNAIMYPTIFALALPEDRGAAAYASMILCMAVVGGAVVPFATGALADRLGLATALGLPLLCYLGIAAFALMVALSAATRYATR